MKLILLLFSFIIFIYPQEEKTGHLFDKYIPDIIKSDKSNLNQIYENIEVNSSLHPSLLYYYFEHLDLRFNQNITKADSNLFLKLSILRNDFRKKRDDFALNQEQLIKQNNYVRIKENAMLSCFDDLFIDYDETKTKVKEDKIDKNKQDYFTVVYLRSRYEDYNPDLNYSKILQEETQDRLNYFRNKRLNFGNMSRDEKISFIDEMNKYWYFFNKEEVDFEYISEFQQSDLAREIYINNFFINENYSAQLFIHPVNINQQTDEIADIITPYKITGSTGSGYKISTKIKMNLQNFFTIYGG